VQHQLAEMLAESLEQTQASLSAEAAAEAEQLVDRALTLSLGRVAHYMAGRLAESVFSGHPKARLKFQSALVDSDSVSHVLLCSDGFARAVLDYGLYRDWPELFQAAIDSGLETVIDGIRAFERKHIAAGTTNHFKRSDDATAILISN